MELLEQLNRVIAYIEENITDDEALARAGSLTMYSPYHFQRMFGYMTNLSLGEYIRRRRLSLAGLEIMSSRDKVIDIALKYGYDSPDGFTRAFIRQHGITPTEAREPGATLRVYPPISFQIMIRGGKSMNCRIETKQGFTAVGIRKRFRNDLGSNPLPDFWSDTPAAAYDALWAANTGEPKGYLGICSDPDGANCFDYWIAAASRGDAPRGMEAIEIPQATWAVIEQDGPLMDVAKRFWTEWLPSSGYVRAGAEIPDIEVYPDRDMPKPDYSYELWFPVVKKD